LLPGTRDLQNNIYQKLAWLLIIASIPGALFGKLLESKAETAFRSPLLIALTMAVFGVVLFVVDRRANQKKNLAHIAASDSVWIGLSQALAVIPGVSRSGATMTSGLLLGFTREDAAKFSFLMSIPIIFGAGLLKLKDFSVGVSHAELLVGFVSAAVFGFLSIKYLMQYLRTASFKLFVWYRIAFAVLILVVYFARR
jgi:undecaprenyl-diphosphatase